MLWSSSNGCTSIAVTFARALIATAHRKPSLRSRHAVSHVALLPPRHLLRGIQPLIDGSRQIQTEGLMPCRQ
jgi:hypothetical protein